MPAGEITILIYALILFAGGWVGFQKAGSKPSLLAGLLGAILLLIGFFVARYSIRAAGYWIGASVAFLMCVAFGIRLSKTGKLMPSGMLLAISIVALGLLAYFAWAAREAA